MKADAVDVSARKEKIMLCWGVKRRKIGHGKTFGYKFSVGKTGDMSIALDKGSRYPKLQVWEHGYVKVGALGLGV